MSVVEKKREEIIEKANVLGMGLRFTQSNHPMFACTSRVYTYWLDRPAPYNCRSENVLQTWSWHKGQDVGSTKRCERYRMYQQVCEYLNDNIYHLTISGEKQWEMDEDEWKKEQWEMESMSWL